MTRKSNSVQNTKRVGDSVSPSKVMHYENHL